MGERIEEGKGRKGMERNVAFHHPLLSNLTTAPPIFLTNLYSVRIFTRHKTMIVAYMSSLCLCADKITEKFVDESE